MLTDILKTVGINKSDPAESNFGQNRFKDDDDNDSSHQDGGYGDNNDAMNFDSPFDAGVKLANHISKELLFTFKHMKGAVTPGFLNRYKNKKIHVKLISTSEGVLDELAQDVNQTIYHENEFYIKEKRKQQRIKERLEREEVNRNEVKLALKAADQIKLDGHLEDYKRRRALQLEELQNATERELRIRLEREEKEAKDMREWRYKHWGEVSKSAHAEATANMKNHLESKAQHRQGIIDKTYDEWSGRQMVHAKLQVEGPDMSSPVKFDQSGKSLGVFGIAMGPGEFHGLFEDSGHKIGVDEHSVHMFSDPTPQTEFEYANIEVMDAEAELTRKQALYDALEYEVKNLDTSMELMADIKQTIEIDFVQVEQELVEMEMSHMGPPRRLPKPPEMLPTHIRKEKSSKLKRKMDEIQHSITLASIKKDAAGKQMLSMAQEIAVLKTKDKSLRSDLHELNLGGGALPIVIGRSITKLKGLEELGQPLEMQNAIYQKSKWVGFDDQSKAILKIHKETVGLDQDLWIARQGQFEMKSDADRIYTKLAEISNKLKTSSVTDTKKNLFEAMNGFLTRKVPLNRVTTKICGVIPWFTFLDKELSSGDTTVIAYRSANSLGSISFEIDNYASTAKTNKSMNSDMEEDPLSNGITLGEAQLGFCAGLVNLPKEALWNITLTIVSQDVNDLSNEYSNDFISVRLGPTISSVTTIGTYFNRVNPDTGSVLHDVKYVFRGKTLGFRFDFSSSTTDSKKHLAICTGIYEEFEMKPLEVLSGVEINGRERVISSLVKTMRLEEAQNKHRSSNLLIELIAAEESDKDFWDSDLMNNYPQRYGKDYFLRIARAEILIDMHIRNQKTQEERVHFERSKSQLLLRSKSSRKALKLISSEEGYFTRKRASQLVDISEGESKVGSTIELYDVPTKNWRHYKILECKVAWIDNGTKSQILYVMQEFNDAREEIGEPVEMDLTLGQRYYESDNLYVDEEALEQQKLQKVWEGRLQELGDEADRRIQSVKESFDAYVYREEQTFKKLKQKKLTYLRDDVEVEAKDGMRDPKSARILRGLVQRVLLDMKKGIVGVDPKIKIRLQAEEVAKERFLNDWVRNTKDEVEEFLALKEGDLKERIKEKRKEFNDFKEKILNESRTERIQLEWNIKERRVQDVAVMKQRVRFDPEVFQKAVPKSQLCEHIRAKAWGDKYGKGIRCVTCGKEVYDSHNDENQFLGHGSGASDWMIDALKRHRDNEQSFRFKNSSEITTIEAERIRLEKENRIMEENEVFFYDFEGLRVVYDFDQRHSKLLKSHGLFRQGLQWTAEELTHYEATKLEEEKERLQLEGMASLSIYKYDPLSVINEPAPTYRGIQERHHAQYMELMLSMGRLHTFQKRILHLKDNRVNLISDRVMYSSVLESLHRDTFVFDVDLNILEADLDKTANLLSTFEKLQMLFKNANRILAQSVKEKKKAEMNQAGVWEDVVERKEVLAFLHDETKELLKMKYLLETKQEAKAKFIDDRRNISESSQKSWLAIEEKVSDLSYCTPGFVIHTKYGAARIVSYRHADKMILATLPFGFPPARLYIHAKEIIDVERSHQKGERILMEMEDDSMQSFVKREVLLIKKEQYLMYREEMGLKRYYEFVDMSKEADKTIIDAIDATVKEKFAVTKTEKYIKIQMKKVNKTVSEIRKALNVEIKEYKGPAVGRPKPLTIWKMRAKKRELMAELSHKFILEGAKKSDSVVVAAMKTNRFNRIQHYFFDDFINAVISEVIVEVAHEAINEGRIAKFNAERQSGLYFPNPVWMQHATYNALAKLWKQRKDYLRVQIEMNLGQANKGGKVSTKVELTNEDISKMKELRVQRKEEKQRQARMNAEMQAEETLCRIYYTWELKENLRERRNMRQEDVAAAKIRKEEKKMEKIAKSAYSVSASIAQNQQATEKVTDFEKRRMELKFLTLERRRQAEEQAYMIIEDTLGVGLREIDKAERQRLAFLKEFGEIDDDEDNDGEDSGDEYGNIQGNVSGRKSPKSAKAKVTVLKVPYWMLKPRDWEEWNTAKQRMYLDFQIKMRMRQKTIQQKAAREKKILKRLEEKSYMDWSDINGFQTQQCMQAELKVIQNEEDLKAAEAELIFLKDNIRKMTIYCREKGEEELNAQLTLKKAEEYARKRDKELEEADAWMKLCERRSKHREKLKRKITEDCKWVDSAAITGFSQRFRTEDLRHRLYGEYFNKIVISIVNKAEVIATERRLMGIQELLSFNREEITLRVRGMKQQWHEFQREEYMRMKRSFLNQKFFPKMRREVLQERFGGWVRFYLWNRGHREAFEMKYEVVKRQLDIDRQFRDQLKYKSNQKAGQEKGRGKDAGAFTIMRKHRERTVQCKLCLQFYLEAQNHAMACVFHASKYILDCPKSCPNPGLTPLCISHRMRRWKCCDSTNKDRPGCSRRFHVPVDSDPIYDKIMAKVNVRDDELMHNLDYKHDQAMKLDWPGQLQNIKRNQVSSVEDVIKGERDIVARFENLKFD